MIYSSEDQIERAVEAKVDHADAALMAGNMTQAEYDARIKQIDFWAERQFAFIRLGNLGVVR